MEIRKDIIEDLDKNEKDELFKFLEQQYSTFIENQELEIPSSENTFYVYRYYPDLQIVMSCYKLFEGYYNDDMIECNPSLSKAITVEDAWKEIVDDIAQNYIWEVLE